MTSVSLKKLNNVEVRPPPTLQKEGRRVKGEKLFAEPYANIFVCARKKSGKSVVIFNILKSCIDKNTTVVFFVSTLYKDPVYRSMLKLCKDNGINTLCYTSLKEGQVDHLQDLVDCLEAEAEEEFKKEEEGDEKKECRLLFEGEEDEEEDKPKRKSKFLAPEYLIIFDDLSDELKSRSLITLLKKNRHWKMKIVVSSQYYHDLLPESRLQIDYLLIFKNITEDKLLLMHKNANLAIDPGVFVKLYHFATQKPFSFFWVDCINDRFRRNFNTELEVK